MWQVNTVTLPLLGFRIEKEAIHSYAFMNLNKNLLIFSACALLLLYVIYSSQPLTNPRFYRFTIGFSSVFLIYFL